MKKFLYILPSILLAISTNTNAGWLGDKLCGKEKLLKNREFILSQIEIEKRNPENIAISTCRNYIERHLDSRSIGYTSISAELRGTTKQYIGVGIQVTDSTDRDNFSVNFSCMVSIDGTRVIKTATEPPSSRNSFRERITTRLQSLETELIVVEAQIAGC